MLRLISAGVLIILLLALGGGGAMASSSGSLATSPGASSTTYSDLSAESVFYPYIQCLTSKEIISGYDDGTFRSGEPVTRGEMARWIALAAGYTDTIPAGQQSFVDVPTSDPNWLHIERIYKHGIVTGYPCGTPMGVACPGWTFHPELKITRAQTAKLVTLAAGFEETIAPARQTFKEVPPTHPYWLFVERAVNHGLVSGYDCDNKTFNVCGPTVETCPGPYYRCCTSVTRSQAAKYIALAFFRGCVP